LLQFVENGMPLQARIVQRFLDDERKEVARHHRYDLGQLEQISAFGHEPMPTLHWSRTGA
jgi:hypothetical protein